MSEFIVYLAARSPSARMWYPFLALFLVACTVYGALMAGLKNAIISDAHAVSEISAIIEYIPDSQKQLEAISEVRI